MNLQIPAQYQKIHLQGHAEIFEKACVQKGVQIQYAQAFHDLNLHDIELQPLQLDQIYLHVE